MTRQCAPPPPLHGSDRARRDGASPMAAHGSALHVGAPSRQSGARSRLCAPLRASPVARVSGGPAAPIGHVRRPRRRWKPTCNALPFPHNCLIFLPLEILPMEKRTLCRARAYDTAYMYVWFCTAYASQAVCARRSGQRSCAPPTAGRCRRQRGAGRPLPSCRSPRGSLSAFTKRSTSARTRALLERGTGGKGFFWHHQG